MKIWIETSVILGITAIAAMTDCRCRKVYNKHLLIGLCFLSIINVVNTSYLGYSFAAFILPFIIHYIPFKLHLVSAGDIKLFMLIGLFTNISFITTCIVFSYLFGGGYALCLMIRRGILRERLSNLYQYLIDMCLTGKLKEYETISRKGLSIPFALMIHLSVLVQYFVYGGYMYV